ncbi:MAG: helix-turn-helix domain-containing protein [Candidatus Omnitrophica bacterium]|nr:helix-turn-helix domain-containing protein [Candidatus Omnitrophota bacterium]
MQRMLTPIEVSSILNVSARTVRRLADSRVIPGARKIGNVWRFDPEKFAHWLSDLEKPERTSEKEKIGTKISSEENP